ncbi:F-box domain-containing protein [Mycena kentingensis (nom. inval.)]|nr:F-box domain-containing protein [Mycena kentingensis (nom. inval.)]
MSAGAETADTPASLRSQLASIDAERASVHSQITALHAKLAELADARKAVAEQLQAVAFPILTLPTEITAEIFLHYAETVADYYGSLQSAPILLTHICRPWRELALALPKLWTQIFMGDESSRGIDYLLRLWFERAGSLPLHVRLPATANTQVSRLLAMLTGYSDQFESFACTYPLPENCSLDPIAGRIDNLRALELEIEGPASEPITAFADAPALRKLELMYYPDDGIATELDLPWAQLTELVVGGELPTLLRTLENMPQLEVLDLVAMRYLAPLNPIQLPKLRSLTCQSQTGSSLRFLGHLTCPALDTLDLHLPGGRHFAILHEFLDHAPRLRALVLQRFIRMEAIDVLMHTPALRKLTLRGIVDQTPLLLSLEADANLVPQLQELHIHRPTLEQPYSAIASLLQSRAAPTLVPAPDHDPNTNNTDSKLIPRLGLRRFSYRTPTHTSFHPTEATPKSMSRAEFAAILQDEIRPLGCKVNVSAPWLVHTNSEVGSVRPIF